MIRISKLHEKLGVTQNAVTQWRKRGFITPSRRNRQMVTDEEFTRVKGILNRSKNLIKMVDFAKENGIKPSTLYSRITNNNLEVKYNPADPGHYYITQEIADELKEEFNPSTDPTEGFVLMTDLLRDAGFSDTKAYNLRDKGLLDIHKIGNRAYVSQEDYNKYCHVDEDTLENFFDDETATTEDADQSSSIDQTVDANNSTTQSFDANAYLTQYLVASDSEKIKMMHDLVVMATNGQ